VRLLYTILALAALSAVADVAYLLLYTPSETVQEFLPQRHAF
jgi:hypothetical protein